MSATIHESGDITNPTIVFLHGLGVSSWSWQLQIASLSSTFHILALDLPGNGASSATDWRSFSLTADEIARIIRIRASSGRAHVVGLSLGGYVALHLLQRAPSVVRSVIVSGVSTHALKHTWLLKLLIPIISYMYRWEFMLRMNVRALKLNEDDVQRAVEDCQRLSAQTIVAIFSEIADGVEIEGIEDIECPLLAVAGEKETDQIKESLTDFMKGTQKRVAAQVPDVGHAWSAEKPDLFTEMIRLWIGKQEVPKEFVLVGGRGDNTEIKE